MKIRFPSNAILPLFLIILATVPLKATSNVTESDTLILKTEKLKGAGLLQNSDVQLKFREIPYDDKRLELIPPRISNLSITHEFIDIRIYAFNNVKNNTPERLDECIQFNFPELQDTAQLPTLAESKLNIVMGEMGSDTVYIIDENINGDYRDDPIRILNKPISEQTTSELFHYWILVGNQKVRASSWIRVFKDDVNNNFYLNIEEYLQSSFAIGNQQFEIQCVNGAPLYRFGFTSPRIAVTGLNGIKKDSLKFSEILKLGEYLKFGNDYYKFEKISNDGKEIMLIKESDVSSLAGNQIGFLAPDFSGVTIDGDSVSLKHFENEYLLLVNVSACYSEPMSYEVHKELSGTYNSKLAIISIDESPGVLEANIKELDLKGQFIISKNNKSIKSHYREDFCSRVCFLIDPSGHIIEKFEIYDWQPYLAKYFN